MEEVLVRFFHLGQQIFCEIDDQSFVNSRQVGRSWKMSIDTDDFAWTKITNKFPCDLETLPLHIAAMTGQTEKFMKLLAEAEDKNPADKMGVTPYHLAAKNGHLQICHLICLYQMTSRESEINPPDKQKFTPFHYAAESGHLSICKFFINTVSNKNPKCVRGATPLHLATAKGHFEICKLIIENVDDKNPKMEFDKWTPLHLAALWGHFEIFQLIYSNTKEKNPRNKLGHTPRDYFTAWSMEDKKSDQHNERTISIFETLYNPKRLGHRVKIIERRLSNKYKL